MCAGFAGVSVEVCERVSGRRASLCRVRERRIKVVGE